jgi:serine/threonine protein kinase
MGSLNAKEKKFKQHPTPKLDGRVMGALSDAIHRDIKSLNILGRTIFIADFGLAKLQDNLREELASISERYKAQEIESWNTERSIS